MAHLTLEEARKQLGDAGEAFVKLFAHGSLEIEYYQPVEIDEQTPHDRDEIYVVVQGSGKFINGTRRHGFGPGDVLHVAAGREHRFVDFTQDFATWVIFYGRRGGEKEAEQERTPEEQMAQFEDALKVEDWGHQPC